VNLLPYEKYILRTQLSVEEIRDRLISNVQPYKFFRLWDAGDKLYEGEVFQDGFIINRVPLARRYSKPVIIGAIRNSETERELVIRMKMNPILLAFMSIWLGIMALLGITVFAGQIIDGRSPAVSLIPFGMFAFGYGMMIFPFNYERNRSKKFLADLLEGEELVIEDGPQF
jgi:hypothetical protein